MKTITVPDDVSVTPPPYMPEAKPEVLSFEKYAHQVWLNDSRAIEGPFTKQCRWARVIEKFANVKSGAKIELEDEDYATLRSIVENPKLGYASALIAVQLIAFPQAVLDAA